MTVRQAGAPITNEALKQAAIDGVTERILLQCPENQAEKIACRLYPALSFFFDGTNNNMERDLPQNKHSNVVKLFRAAKDSIQEDARSIYLSGVGTPFKFVKVAGYTDHLKDDEGGVLGLGLGAGGVSFVLSLPSRNFLDCWKLNGGRAHGSTCAQLLSRSSAFLGVRRKRAHLLVD